MLIRELKPALANVLGVIKRNQHLPTLEAAKVTVGGGKLKLLATDRFIVIEHAIDYEIGQEFSYVLDEESLQLLAKLPPMQQVDFTPDGVVAKNIKFTPADVDFPETVGDLLEKAWDDYWKKPVEREWKCVSNLSWLSTLRTWLSFRILMADVMRGFKRRTCAD